jgi:cell division septal protein FtsQ
MAYLNVPLKHHAPAAPGESVQFQRGLEKIPVKKIQRKVTVKFKHIFLFFFLLLAIFFSLMKFYLYLITCDQFAVKKTQIVCQRDFVGRDIQALLDASKLGNLLLLDIGRLQARIEAHRWVKEARLRKVFPSSLKIEIQEREPAAVLQVGASLLLIDEAGVELERLASRDETELPLLLDSSFFQSQFKDKLTLAWECLKSLSLEQKAEVDALDLSENENVIVYLKGNPTRLVLGNERFSAKLEYYQSSRENLERENGALEYVDLRFFDSRIYLKPLPAVHMAALANPKQEVN